MTTLGQNQSRNAAGRLTTEKYYSDLYSFICTECQVGNRDSNPKMWHAYIAVSYIWSLLYAVPVDHGVNNIGNFKGQGDFPVYPLGGSKSVTLGCHGYLEPHLLHEAPGGHIVH